ncbi:hypothetical protein GOQ30_03240 [Flavobacterium sp. TP390]|uniref:Metal-dependent HD superfamily phosphohydrolase n=1 Tax=Flavobacterium profundi TaxID=1774945 RepID=A0A6I4IJM4_9FLAO|nr:hypothetical protein [Flavobacterium profundi]MVO08179.1 hypothetical protein [Flavobacterium profundi]
MSLQSQYDELLLRIGFEKFAIDKHWILLEKAYSAKSRKYHNLTHLENMMRLYKLYQEEINHSNEIEYAIFYHDIIYKVTRKDNELESAKLAIKLLPEFAKIDTKLVFEMICATQMHEYQGEMDINWLLDFDLQILAAPWKDYEVYYKQIRQEYKIYPNMLYNPGRKKALQHFLERDFIFQTDVFRAAYEAKARENIKKEILLL